MNPPPLHGSKPKSAVSPLLIALVGLLILLVPFCTVLQEAGDGGGNKAAQSIPYTAAAMVKKAMSDEKTAEATPEGWKPRKDGAFEAWGTVRAQNLYGAYLTKPWRIVIKSEDGGKTFSALWVKIGDDATSAFPEDRP